MEKSHSPKTLQMLVKNQWLVDSIIGLGSGYFIHLVYQTNEISPEVLTDIRNHNLEEKVLGEVVFETQRLHRCIAKVEIFTINDFQSFVRFDFRLLEVSPFLRESSYYDHSDYLCCFKKNPV